MGNHSINCLPLRSKLRNSWRQRGKQSCFGQSFRRLPLTMKHMMPQETSTSSNAEPKRMAGQDKQLEQEVQEMKGQLINLTKHTQQCSMETKELKAILVDSWLEKETGVAVQQAKIGTAAYMEMQRQLKEKHSNMGQVKSQLGNPNKCIFNQWVKYAIEAIQVKQPEQAKAIQEVVDQWKSWKVIQEHFPLIKVRKTHKKELRRLEITVPYAIQCQMELSVNPGSPWAKTPTGIWLQHIQPIILPNPQNALIGQQPKGHMERVSQAFLDKEAPKDMET